MKKIAILLGFCMVVALLPTFMPQPVSAHTGSGTAGDPYMAYNVTDLQDMQNHLSSYWELANDIDASATSGWNGGAGFEPIGTFSASPFTGHFDGNNYTISALYIDRPSTQNVGLFEYINGGVIENVVLENPDITGYYKVGIVSGSALNTIYRYVWISGGAVTATGSDVGAFGQVCSGSGYIYRCFSSASVTSSGSSAGGFTGQTATIYESYCYGAVSGTSYVGGLVGQEHSGIIQDSFARGSVTGISAVGGLVGSMTDYYGASTVDNCYSTGTSSIMGLIGSRTGATYVTDSFWDTQTSGCPSSAGGTGKTTAEMKTQATFTDAGWNFTGIWSIGGYINDGYPYFEWWYNPPDIIADVNQVVWFQPNAIIEGIVLPNRAQSGTLQDGEFTWGANPVGVTISHGELIPEEEYDFEPVIPSSQDIIKPEPSTMIGDVDTARLHNNPLYPLVQVLSIGGFLNERLVWLGLAWFILIAAMFGVHLGFDTHKGTERPQHFVLTTIVGLGFSILFYMMGIFPWWVILLMAFGLLGAIIWERQPVL